LPKITILDEILLAFDTLKKFEIPLLQILAQIKENREQNNKDVGDFECLKSYIRWSILSNSGGRERDLFTIKNDSQELVILKNCI